MKRTFLFAALIFAANPCRATTNDFFANGLAAADAGDFSAAASDFEKSAEQNPSSGALLNLGICEWQCGHAGAAILALERAQWIDPLDRRAAQNLKFAREVVQVDAPQLKWFETASIWLPPNVWVWIAGASLWLAVGALILPRVFRRRKSGCQQMLAALGFGLFLFSMTANLGVLSRTQTGFILKRDVPLRLTPTREAETISALNAGEPARRLRTRGNYFLIRTAYGSGWVQKDEFGLVNPE